jgi:peptide/nickel transport system permease protein
MRAYIVRRLLLVIPTLFLVTIIVFSIIRLIPGDVVEIMATEYEFTLALDVDAIRHELGLDMPLHIQYGRWLGVLPTPDIGFSGVIQGNLGNSLWTGKPVTYEVFTRMPVSFELGFFALIIGQIIALPIGIYSAIRQDTWGDYIGRSFAIFCIAVPSFWLGTMAVIFPAKYLGWSPSVEYVGFLEDPVENIKQFIIPSIILGMNLSGVTMRMTRTMMLEVLRQDYIRTAWSKGLNERVVIFRHAMKNAMIPVVTIVGMQLPLLIGGSAVLESIFALPGIGGLLIKVINNRDYLVLSGINMIMATFVLLINLVVDITYAYLDPRVHYG